MRRSFTYDGLAIDLDNVKPESISFLHIAHCLSRICRYTGNVIRPYYVAEHSLLVAECLPQSVKPFGLMHDGSESFHGDVIAPWKIDKAFEEFRKKDDRTQDAIYIKYCGRLPTKEEMKILNEVDLVMRAVEARDNLKNKSLYAEAILANCDIPHVTLQCLEPTDAKLAFIEKAIELKLPVTE